MGSTTYLPDARFRVLATDWEGEAFAECWTETLDAAETIAAALTRGGASVRIDRVACPANGRSAAQTS